MFILAVKAIATPLFLDKAPGCVSAQVSFVSQFTVFEGKRWPASAGASIIAFVDNFVRNWCKGCAYVRYKK